MNFARHTDAPKEMLFSAIPAVRDRILEEAKKTMGKFGLDAENAIIYATAFAIYNAFNAC